MTAACDIKGPYYPVGDVDFWCVTHDVAAELRDPYRWGAPDIRTDEMRCPVGEPIKLPAHTGSGNEEGSR